MFYYITVIRDKPLGFWKLDESSGNVAYDFSGCDNHGSYVNSINKVSIPLVSDGLNSVKINNLNYINLPISKDYSGSVGNGGFATSETSDNDFSLEVWFHPKNLNSLTPILADTNDIGIYWDNGNIVFKLESERLDYTVPNKNKSLHVVAVYSIKSIALFVDGVLVKNKLIERHKFSNTSLSLAIGPSVSGQEFLVDAPAVYRYALREGQIRNHYLASKTTPISQIVFPDGGLIFKASEKHESNPDKFLYPQQKNWSFFENEDLSYDQNKNSLYLDPGKTSGNFVDIIGLIDWKNYIGSKIEWTAGSGVSVFVSTDSESGPWVECENGKAVPGFVQGSSFSNEKIIFIKVQFNSSNSNVYLPEIYDLTLSFYLEKKLYCHNGYGFISTDESTNVNSWDIDISSKEYGVIERSMNDGIIAGSSGFYIEYDIDTKFIEMILTPTSLGTGYLVYNNTNSSEYSLSWDSNGVITKSNISSLYLNGQDVSSAINISSYLNIGEPNYVLIKFNSSLSGKIWINCKNVSGFVTGSLPKNTYKNIALYDSDQISHLDHYNMYVGRIESVADDSGISMTELGVFTYSNDWVRLDNA